MHRGSGRQIAWEKPPSTPLPRTSMIAFMISRRGQARGVRAHGAGMNGSISPLGVGRIGFVMQSLAVLRPPSGRDSRCGSKTVKGQRGAADERHGWTPRSRCLHAR